MKTKKLTGKWDILIVNDFLSSDSVGLRRS